MSIYVITTGQLLDGVEAWAFERAIEQVSRTIAEHTGSVIIDELIRDSEDPSSYVMVSTWSSKEEWDRWRATPIHIEHVSPLRSYWQMHTVRAYETAFVNERSPLLS